MARRVNNLARQRAAELAKDTLGPNARALGLALTEDENTYIGEIQPNSRFSGAFYPPQFRLSDEDVEYVRSQAPSRPDFRPGALVASANPVTVGHELAHRVQAMGGAGMGADETFIREFSNLIRDIGGDPDIIAPYIEQQAGIEIADGLASPHGGAVIAGELLASLVSGGLDDSPAPYRQMFSLPTWGNAPADAEEDFYRRRGKTIREEAQRIYDEYLNRNTSGAMKERAERTLEEPINRLTERGAAGRPTYF